MITKEPFDKQLSIPLQAYSSTLIVKSNLYVSFKKFQGKSKQNMKVHR